MTWWSVPFTKTNPTQLFSFRPHSSVRTRKTRCLQALIGSSKEREGGKEGEDGVEHERREETGDDEQTCGWNRQNDKTRTQTHTHTHPFNGPLSRTTRVSRYQKGKTNLDFTEARDSEWQWNPLGRVQVYTSLQTDNHASNPPLSFTGRMPFLPPNQQRQSTKGKDTERDAKIVITSG